MNIAGPGCLRRILAGLFFAVITPVWADESTVTALRVADYLLSQQDAAGCIPDLKEGHLCNEDSTMEYALVGLAAAGWHSQEAKYREGVRQGIAWLAARQEMTDPRWRGSWRYAFATHPPYAAVPTSPGPGIKDVRGVDATGALFAYDLFLYTQISGTNALAREYETNARAGLDFVLSRNLGPDGFAFSSWQRKRSGAWQLWRYEYTADQVDVYLGLRAGALLYHEPRYQQAADFIAQHLGPAFFAGAQGRFAEGREADGRLNLDLQEFNAVFPQGYAPWALGKTTETVAAGEWLAQHRQADGSLACYPGDPHYTLSVAVDAMAAGALGRPRPDSAMRWLTTIGFDPAEGGMRDTAKPGSEKYSNVAGFSIVALLQFPAFPARATF